MNIQDEAYPTEDEAAEAKRAEVARLTQRDNDDLQWLMADKRGRRVMQRLLDKAGIYRSSFTGNSETFFREGERNVGLYWVARIHEVCPDRYLLMIKEQRSDVERLRSNDH
jgi:hypothetical protein